jgi:hypothetical protein
LPDQPAAPDLAPPDPASINLDAFLARWAGASGSERANYQLFVGDLCALLGLPAPQPARDDTRDNAYVFERRVTFRHGDGAASVGFIDCYGAARSCSKPSACAPRARASTTPCCARAARPRAMRARCPPTKAAHPCCWWWTWAR